MKQTLMERLEAEGYPAEKMFHHASDLYVYATPLTRRVITEWFKENGLRRELFVSKFNSLIDGKTMYDIAFQYTPFWEGHRE